MKPFEFQLQFLSASLFKNYSNLLCRSVMDTLKVLSEHNVVLIHIGVKFLDNSKIVRYMILSIAALWDLLVRSQGKFLCLRYPLVVIIRKFVRIILGWSDQGPVWDNSPIYPILDIRNFVWHFSISYILMGGLNVYHSCYKKLRLIFSVV